MQNISTLFKLPPRNTKGANSERSELIGWFANKLNAARLGKYKALPVKVYAVRCAHLTLSDLYAIQTGIRDRERRGENWGAYWWAITKTNYDI